MWTYVNSVSADVNGIMGDIQEAVQWRLRWETNFLAKPPHFSNMHIIVVPMFIEYDYTEQ